MGYASLHPLSNEEELAFFEAHPTQETFLLLWSAKETLYKIVGQGFAFKHNLALFPEGVDLSSNGTLPAFVQKDDFAQEFEVHFQVHPEFILTYTVEC